MYTLRDNRAKRRLLKKVVNPALADTVGFAVVDGVWTWHCDMVGRCKLHPSLKATCFQPLNMRVRTVLST